MGKIQKFPYIYKEIDNNKDRILVGNGDYKSISENGLVTLENANTQKEYCSIAGSGILHRTITNKRLARIGYYDISEAYKSLHYL